MEAKTSALGKVTVGDEELTITRFRGHKAILAGALIKRVMSETPAITKKVNEFRKDYRDNNYFEITHDMAKLPRFQEMYGVDPETVVEPLRLQENPDDQAVMMNVFPDIWELAEKELTMFLGLIVVSDSDLERADDADQINDMLSSRGKQLLNRGYIDELLELCIVGWEVLQDQIVKKRDRLGKLKDIPLLGTLLSTPVAQDESETKTPETSPPESQTSSTDSPDSTDGADEKPSTESPGTSLSSSSSSMKESLPINN